MSAPGDLAVTPSLLPVIDGLYAIANARPWTADRWSRFVALLDDVGRFALLEPTPEPIHRAPRPPVVVPENIPDSVPAMSGEAVAEMLGPNIGHVDAEAISAGPALPATHRPPRPVRPLAPVTVACDPGCGQPFSQTEIAAHRRDCEAVRRYKEERGVTLVPSLVTAAPLPPVPESDFEARRIASARAATEESWRRSHPGEPDRPNGHAPLPADAAERLLPAPVHQKRVVGADGLTSRQRQILELLARHRGDRRAVAKELGVAYQSIDGALQIIGRKGLLPIELIGKLPARFARYTGGVRR